MNYETVSYVTKNGELMVAEEEFEDDEEIFEEEGSSLFENLKNYIFVCGSCGEHCYATFQDYKQILVICPKCNPEKC